MLKRVIWMAAGVAIGVIAVRKVSTLKDSAGPAGVNRMVGSLTSRASSFAGTFRESMSEREAELRAALGLDAH